MKRSRTGAKRERSGTGTLSSDRLAATRRARGLGVLLLIPFFAFGSSAQESNPANPYRVVTGADVTPAVTPGVKDIDLRYVARRRAWRPGDGIKFIPKRSSLTPKLEAHHARLKPLPAQDDPLMELQRNYPQRRAFTSPDVNVSGNTFTGASPPDTVLDVGNDYVIQSVNSSSGSVFTVYNKSDGNLIAGPLYMQNLATSGSDCATGAGDPIILYDEMAQRWLLSEFSDTGNKMCVYISQTANPVSGGWFSYEFQAPQFPDYPKYGVWLDGYYIGTNENSGPKLYVVDRTAMLAGSPATLQSFSVSSLNGFGFQMLTPADHDGTLAPPAGSPGYFMRHVDDEAHNPGGANASADYLEIYELSVDWDTPGNSQLSGPTSLAVANFDSDLCGYFTFSCIPQPSGGTPLDPLREVVMWRLAYRNMGTHETLVGSHVTDVTGTDRAGVRWWELRRIGSGSWTVFQEGTYAPDNQNRWMSSLGMDRRGNIALGYSIGGISLSAGIRYTGRLATDPAGVMSQAETTVASGSGAAWGERWGDYSALSVDPEDGCTFWYTNEYAKSNGDWATQIASFSFDGCFGETMAISGTNLTQSVCAPGDMVPIDLQVTGTGGFTDDVTLSLSPLPQGFSASFAANPVAVGDSSTLQVSLGNNVNVGVNDLHIVASAPGVDDKTLAVEATLYGSALPMGPNLDKPYNGLQVGVSPTFSWAPVIQAGSYTLEIDDDPNFSSIDYSWTGIATSHTVSTPLVSGTAYSWRVRVANACAATNSDVRTFAVESSTLCETPNATIPDGVGVPLTDSISVSDSSTISGLEVKVDIAHTFVGDLEVMLTHVDTGTSVSLIERPGLPLYDPIFGCDGDDIDVLLSDLASNDVQDQCATSDPAISGTARPKDALSAFDGEDIAGTWQISVSDHEFSDEGQLNTWCLQGTAVPEPGGMVMLLSGILFMAAERAVRRRSR